MVELIRGSEGHGFQLGPNLYLYAGPGQRGQKLPVLAIKGPRDKKDVVLADFRNSTAAARFINELQATLDSAASLRVGPAAPELTEEQAAEVARFGLDTPPTAEEEADRLRLIAAEMGLAVDVVTDEAVA